MSYLLDTNVISEWSRPLPDARVIDWLASADEDRLFLSVVTLGEIRRGMERLASGAKRTRLDLWLRQDVAERFGPRILPVDVAIADAWGMLLARSQSVGRSVPTLDAFIAATAERHGLTLVTRNVRDFEFLGIRMFNPWSEPQV